jgi:hypothetical protein
MNALTKSRNFSLTFEQMCNFAAIAKTQDADETLRQLIQLCLVILPDEKFESTSQIMEAMSLFDLQFPERQVQAGLNRLIVQGRILQPTNTYFTVPDSDRTQLQTRIGEVKALEERVKQEWLEEISKRFPTLETDQAWKALQGHLASVFRNHGIQAIALLDPSIYTPPEQVENLSSLLNEALKDLFLPEQRAIARDAISSFLSTVGEHPERAKYITQLGDGVFIYFSLTVEPGLARHFHKKLSPLTLFFDTNFLFQICNFYGTGPEKEASYELLRIVERHKFPFRLRYHQATRQEMRSTIDHYGAILRSGQSRSIPTSIELVFHELNAKTGIDVDTFLKPYEHFDVFLTDKKILIHRTQAERRREHTPLLQEYRRFLEVRGKFKGEESLKHDMTLLEAVHQLRSKAKSSLEAGALLITLDTFLYRFDWEISRTQGRPACVVLPDHFMQVLRPFVPSDSDFDRSFAATFALPEFRAMESKLSEAKQQLFSYLTSYELIPEETAASLLTNGLLMERLHKVENDEQLQKDVESAMVYENAALLEEKAVLEKLLEREKAERAAKEKQLEQEKIEAEQMKARAEQAEQLLRQQAKELASLKKQAGRQGSGESKQQKIQVDQALELAAREKQAREEAEKRAQQEASLRQKTEQRAHIYATLASIMLSIILIAVFELLISLIPGASLTRYRNRYGLQAAIDSLLLFIIVGFFHPHRRSWFWGVGALALLGTILQLL